MVINFFFREQQRAQTDRIRLNKIHLLTPVPASGSSDGIKLYPVILIQFIHLHYIGLPKCKPETKITPMNNLGLIAEILVGLIKQIIISFSFFALS